MEFFGNVVISQEAFDAMQQAMLTMGLYGVAITFAFFTVVIFATMLFIQLRAHARALRIANERILDLNISLEAKEATLRDYVMIAAPKE